MLEPKATADFASHSFPAPAPAPGLVFAEQAHVPEAAAVTPCWARHLDPAGEGLPASLKLDLPTSARRSGISINTVLNSEQEPGKNYSAARSRKRKTKCSLARKPGGQDASLQNPGGLGAEDQEHEGNGSIAAERTKARCPVREN